MKTKKDKTTFICQITETVIKVVKCLRYKKEFTALEVEMLSSGADDKEIVGKLNRIFKKLQYERSPVIISLPRNQATSRYLKVPAKIPQEIENIVSMQAPRYLPYPANELITGFQIISTDKEGYSHLNLVIAHKDAIEHYIKIFKEFKALKISIILSSYGLCNLYNYMQPAETGTVMFMDIDSEEAELTIISAKKLFFSRSFKVAASNPEWRKLLIKEIDLSRDAYLKDVSGQAPAKIIVVGAAKVLPAFMETLNRESALPVESLSYIRGANLSNNLASMLNLDYSFAGLIGLGLAETNKSLNLLPYEIKKADKDIVQHKERLRIISFISGIILLWGLGLAKDIDNKTKYLTRLKAELNKIIKEVKPLENIEKRFDLFESHLQNKPTGLELLYELHQIIPDQISLLNLSYDTGAQVILRGQTKEMNSIFLFVSQLEKSAVFKKFDIKVRYASTKESKTGEVVDFEIGCFEKRR